MRAFTVPVGPPGMVTHSSSIASFAMSLVCTSSTGFAALGRGQLEQKRRIGGRLDERLRGRLKRGRVGCRCRHGWLLYWLRQLELTGRGCDGSGWPGCL